MNSELIERARQWLQHDPDPASRDELASCIDAAANSDAALADLAERFSGPLEFGTAGLRGLIGAGESRMNRAVVLRTTHGLATYLLRQPGSEATKRGVVIGYDGRRMSREFAEDTARVFAAAGIPSHVSPIPCPTPLTAFMVNRFGAAAGVMITASHNPPAYNGYKVYWDNGAQIIPPHDSGIATAVLEAPRASEVPRLPLEEATQRGLVREVSLDVEREYLTAVRALGLGASGDRSMPIVYTPLHGVGNRLVRRALAEASFDHVSSVPEQAEPDGAFPTVAFPNPEEKGALDLAYLLADREGADLVLANDPDVDRLAVAVRGPSGAFVQLSGNQVGVLLGTCVLKYDPGPRDKRLIIASCVSSPMLGDIAREVGVRYEETLTGFKWIANRAMELENEGYRFLFGFEEALGYTVGSLVRDKDGISAAMIVAELASLLRSKGQTLLDELEALYRRHGLYASGQRAITLPGADGLARIRSAMETLRSAPPKQVAECSVVAMSDFQTGVRTDSAGSRTQLSLPSTNMIVFELDGGSRIIARPSGTEPKIKFYFDVREPMTDGDSVEAANTRAHQAIDSLAASFCAIAGVT